MDTVVISSKRPFELEPIRLLLSKEWTVTTAFNGSRLVVHDVDGRAYIYPTTDESSQSPGEYTLLLDYRTVRLAKKILETVADDASLTIDNDFGLILPGNEFVAKIRQNPAWDWRAEFRSSR
jgi:hypothetical protein